MAKAEMAPNFATALASTKLALETCITSFKKVLNPLFFFILEVYLKQQGSPGHKRGEPERHCQVFQNFHDRPCGVGVNLCGSQLCNGTGINKLPLAL